jgi:hypothetical protein
MTEQKQISFTVDKAVYMAYRKIIAEQRLVTGATIKRDLKAVVERHLVRVVDKNEAKKIA